MTRNVLKYGVFAVLIIAILAAIYNAFHLNRVKNFYKDLYKAGVLKPYLLGKLAQEKCEFNALISGKTPTNADYFIAHAGGGIIQDGAHFSYTNSREALLQSIAEGFKFIELDLVLNDEGEIFATHDYKHFYGITGANLDENATQTPPSRAYIENAKIHGRFETLNLDEINEIFLQNPHLILVTDKLNDFEKMAQQLKFKERVLVEAFGVQNYFKARKFGFKAMLSSADFDLAKKLNINALAFHTSVLKDENAAKKAADFLKNGGCAMVFSSNEKAFVKAHLGKTATAFYTDFYDINADDCKLKDGKCTTY